jgi:hypothetical protein
MKNSLSVVVRGLGLPVLLPWLDLPTRPRRGVAAPPFLSAPPSPGDSAPRLPPLPAGSAPSPSHGLLLHWRIRAGLLPRREHAAARPPPLPVDSAYGYTAGGPAPPRSSTPPVSMASCQVALSLSLLFSFTWLLLWR